MAAASKPALRSNRRATPVSVDALAPEKAANIGKASATQRPKHAHDDPLSTRPTKKQRAEDEVRSRRRPASRSEDARISHTPRDGVTARMHARTDALPLREAHGPFKSPGRALTGRKAAPAPLSSITKPIVVSTAVHAGDEKRTLRSQIGASRFKSDLSLFFPYYDEMISNEPKTPGEMVAARAGPS